MWKHASIDISSWKKNIHDESLMTIYKLIVNNYLYEQGQIETRQEEKNVQQFFNISWKIFYKTGYVAKGPTVTQKKSGKWNPSLDQFSCTESVILLTGGKGNNGVVEVYGKGFHQHLSDLPFPIFDHTADFINGMVLLCGGDKNKQKCMKGIYNKKKSGKNQQFFRFEHLPHFKA